MRKPQRGRSRNQPNNNLTPPNSTAETAERHSQHLVQTQTSETGEANPDQTKKIDATVHVVDDEKWTRSEYLTAFAIFVSIVMAVVTYRLFNQTLISNKTAITADSIAQASLDESKSYNSASLEEIRKESEPYLELRVVTPITYEDGFINFSYQIFNLGKYPAKARKIYIKIAIGLEKDSIQKFNLLIKETKYEALNEYITSYDPTKSSPYKANMPKEIFLTYTSGISVFFLYGEMFYTDVISNKERKYNFKYEVGYNKNKVLVGIFENENVDLKKSITN